MDQDDQVRELLFSQQDHQAAYIFEPEPQQHEDANSSSSRPPKRRRVGSSRAPTTKRGGARTGNGSTTQRSRNHDGSNTAADALLFMPLLSGGETEDFVRLRQDRFQQAWDVIDQRITGILRDSNAATLSQVADFVASAQTECGDRIPAGLIVTGPNLASQELLFEQLAENLQQRHITATGNNHNHNNDSNGSGSGSSSSSSSGASRFVILKSSEAPTLKAALKKVIRDALSARRQQEATEDAPIDDDGPEKDDGDGGGRSETTQNGRRYLDYDLEALETSTRPMGCEHVFVAFQDSEGFDSTLLSDLIALFHSWRPRIPFTLLFGIATSVELLQLRLLKSACRLLYGAQFDGVQTAGILEAVFRGAVAAADVPLRLGASILSGMLDRQHEQVAGIQAFVSSLKYAYMCHFYANPLSVLCSVGEDAVGIAMNPQREHLAAARNLASFRNTVQQEVDKNTRESLDRARSLIEDDAYLLEEVRAGYGRRQAWADRFLRSLLILQSAGALRGSFSRAYVEGMIDGAFLSPHHPKLVPCIRRMTPDQLCTLLQQVIAIFNVGDASLHLDPTTDEHDAQLVASLESKLEELEQLRAQALQARIDLRSKYSGHGKVVRTTVIAQKVQLSQDSAALRDEDNKLTDIIDYVTSSLSTHYPDTNPHSVLFAECWLYSSKSPSREVFVPRSRAAIERSLERPHDYLGLSYPKPDDGKESDAAQLPPASLLYRLYLDCGSLINVADLWTAFHGLLSQGDGTDERKILLMFYRGLAELRILGFVKSSKKKVDHVAKVKWL